MCMHAKTSKLVVLKALSKERLQEMCQQDAVMREKTVMKLVQKCSPFVVDFDFAFMCKDNLYF